MYTLRITITCTDQIDRVKIKVKGVLQHINWHRQDEFKKFWIDDYQTDVNPFPFELWIWGFNHTDYTYKIERKEGNAWKLVDKGTFPIESGGKHGFEKVINLLSGAEQNIVINTNILV